MLNLNIFFRTNEPIQVSSGKKPSDRTLENHVDEKLFQEYVSNYCIGVDYLKAKSLAIKGIKLLNGDGDIRFVNVIEKISAIDWAIKFDAATRTKTPFTNGTAVLTKDVLKKNPNLIKELQNAAYKRGSSHYGGRAEKGNLLTASTGYGIDVSPKSNFPLAAGMKSALIHPIDTPKIKNRIMQKGIINSVAFKFESHGTKGFVALILHMLDFVKKNILKPLGLYRENLTLKHRRENDFPKSIQNLFKLCCKDKNFSWKVEKKNMKQFGIAYIYNWCKSNHFDQTCLLIKEIEEKFGKANLDIRKGSELIIDKTFLEYYKNIEI